MTYLSLLPIAYSFAIRRSKWILNDLLLETKHEYVICVSCQWEYHDVDTWTNLFRSRGLGLPQRQHSNSSRLLLKCCKVLTTMKFLFLPKFPSTLRGIRFWLALYSQRAATKLIAFFLLSSNTWTR